MFFHPPQPPIYVTPFGKPLSHTTINKLLILICHRSVDEVAKFINSSLIFCVDVLLAHFGNCESAKTTLVPKN